MKPVTLAQAIPAPAAAASGAGSAGADGFAELIQALLTGPAKGTAPAPAAGPGPEPKKQDDTAEAAADQPVLPAIPAQFAALAQAPAPALPAAHDAPRDAADGPALPQPAVAAVPSAPLPAAAVPAPVAATPSVTPTSPVQDAPAPAEAQPSAPAPGSPAGAISHAVAAASPAAPVAPQRGSGPVAAESRVTPAREAEKTDAPAPVPATTTGTMLPAAPAAAPAVTSAAPAPVAPVAVEAPAVQVRPGLRAPEPAVEQLSTPADTAPQGTSVQAPAVPQAAPAPTASTAVAAPAAPAPVRVPADYTAQLARPLVTIAAAGRGEHTMTVKVTPENLGPVTVQAHISGGNIRIEMFAASADGRDVLRQALPDLKRDLAGAGISASLDLSSNGQSGSPQGGQDRETFTRRYPTANQPAPNGRPLEMKDQNTRRSPGLSGPDTLLDVMA